MGKSKKISRYNEIIPVFVWTFIFVLPFLLRVLLFRNDPRNGSLLDIFFSFLSIIIIFYVHTYLVYPVLQKKNGKLYYTLLLVICLLFFFLSMNTFMHDLSGVAQAHGVPYDRARPGSVRFLLVFPFTLIIFCSYFYRLYIEKIKQNEVMKEMETTHLKTELDFLRSQISPHFMFNLMNTLVSMARKKSTLMEPSLISLSQLMRYMLYDSNGDKITLEKEIEYLKNYINLQLLRFGDTIRFNLFVSGEAEGYKIEPMLLIPFVENAFKHGTQTIEQPILEVIIKIDNGLNTLALTVINNKNPDKNAEDKKSGIGLVNVLRRLELLYPNKHHINIDDSNELYVVNLTINL